MALRPRARATSNMRIETVLEPSLCLVLSGCRDRDAVLAVIAEQAAGVMGSLSPNSLLKCFLEREHRFPTGTPEGVAFPHALVPELERTRVSAVLLRPPLRWGPYHTTNQDIVFTIIGNAERPWEHVRTLARLARLSRGDGALASIRAATDGPDLYRRMIEEDRRYA